MISLHSKALHEQVTTSRHTILYGPDGAGKYTFAMQSIYPSFSLPCAMPCGSAMPCGLQTRPISVDNNKQEIYIQCGPRHYEVDVSLFGCTNTRQIWHEVFTQISEIQQSKSMNPLELLNKRSGLTQGKAEPQEEETNKSKAQCKAQEEEQRVEKEKFVLLLLHVESISYEILDVMHGYMQESGLFCFYLLTTSFSFLPENIVRQCDFVRVPKPTRGMLEHIGIDTSAMSSKQIASLENITTTTTTCRSQMVTFCQDIVDLLEELQKERAKAKERARGKEQGKENVSDVLFQVRDCAYNLLIYNLDIGECVYYLLSIWEQTASTEQLAQLQNCTISFFHHLASKYRPIYHLEKWILDCIEILLV